MSNLKDSIARFRAQQAASAKVIADGAKNRERVISRAAPKRKAAAVTAAPLEAAPEPKLSEAQKFKARTAAPLRGVVNVPKKRGKNTSHLQKKVKDIVQFLKTSDGPRTPPEIKAAVKDLDGSGIDIPSTEGLEQALIDSGRVAIVDGGARYAFQAEFQVKNKAEVMKLLRANANGLPVEDLKDAYKEAEADIAALVAAGDAYRIYSWDVQADIVFPADRRSKELLLTPVDEDLADLFRREEIPIKPDELSAALVEAKIQPAVRTAERKRPMPLDANAGKKKRRRAARQRVFTNTHMPELFDAPQPDKIDQ